ncbi:ABC-2 type transport system permease protein [Gracilibacillus ureilyticus]|uniref:Transport permease protein n=1 Tax=Gracilibacillus ureilyticus TaxID=531814 RepID=A0A1H9NBX4_9BACI|nr:ABC transporter permease [Gracilibacillus ureilyticus]SER33185.1 ABC-2 type transport system permease protein [Gracilibacillus ureilyticus]
MYAVIMLEWKKSIQDRGLLFWTLVLPIIFTVIFISIFSSGLSGSERQQVIVSIVSGYTVMFVFFIMISMVDSFIKDCNIGMVARISSTNLKPHLYLLGKWNNYMYIVIIQIVILTLFGKIVYNIPLGQPVHILILYLFLTIMVTGLGLALAMTVRTLNMGIALTQVIALGGAVLSGLWIPVEMMPSFLQNISKFLPQYWAHQALQDAMEGTIQLGDLFITILVLLGFTILGFVIALLGYPGFLKRAKG